MARTPTDTQVEQFTDASQENQALEEIRVENNAVAAADAVIMGSFDVIKALGRIETAQFYETISEKLIAETAINLREGKKYKGLPYKDENGNVKHVSHFDEFCQAFLGKSYRRVHQLVEYYNALGPDLYEQAEKLGFRQKDYNALKALPADDRQLIAQAIEAESLDSALDLMQQLAAKHQREKSALETETAELKKSIASKDAVIQKKIEFQNELEQELERQRLDRPQGAHVNWPEAFRNGYFQQLAITRKNIKHAIGSLDLIREDAMKLSADSEAEEAALTQAREILAAELVGIHNECADMLEALGMSFDRTLGGYCDARIRWLAQS
jgi:G:T/U-mismatch repair DNA glycosylase